MHLNTAILAHEISSINAWQLAMMLICVSPHLCDFEINIVAQPLSFDFRDRFF